MKHGNNGLLDATDLVENMEYWEIAKIVHEESIRLLTQMPANGALQEHLQPTKAVRCVLYVQQKQLP